MKSPEHAFSADVILLHPQARGWVTLKSPDPRELPAIRLNLFDNEADFATARAGLRLARQIYATEPMAGLIARESIPGAEVQTDEAIDHLRRSVAGSGIIGLKGELGVALAKAGREDEAREILVELETQNSLRYVSPHWRSVIHAALGEKERALDCLAQAWDVRSVQLIWLGVDPSFDSLRDEPRFLEVFEKMKIPTSSSSVRDPA